MTISEDFGLSRAYFGGFWGPFGLFRVNFGRFWGLIRANCSIEYKSSIEQVDLTVWCSSGKCLYLLGWHCDTPTLRATKLSKSYPKVSKSGLLVHLLAHSMHVLQSMEERSV